MFQIGSAVKWIVIAGILSSILYGLNWVYDYHLDAIQTAINDTKLEFANQQKEVKEVVVEKLIDLSEEERSKLEAEAEAGREEVEKLRRMLKEEHNLRKLLQSKPDLIISRINDGTAKYYAELEEATK